MSGRTANVIPALWLLMLVNYLDRVAISFAGPTIMKALSLTPSSFGIVLSSFGIGFMLAQVPGGLLADRWGAKRLLVIGPILWAVFTGVTGIASTLGGLIAARVCFGISEGLSNTAFWKLIGDSFDSRQRSRVLGICMTPIALAPAIGGPIAGGLVGAIGWQGMFFALVGPALLVAVLNAVLIPARLGRGRPSGKLGPKGTGALRHVLGLPSLWVQCALQLGINIASWGYLGWMPSYLALQRHLDLKSLGPLAGIPYVFAFFGMLLGGWLGGGSLHRHRPQLAICAYLATAISLFLAYQAATLPLALVALSSAAFFLFGSLSPTGAVALDLAPRAERATYVAIFNSAGQVGGILAPAVVGYLVGRTGTFASGFAFMTAALVLASTCMLGLIPLLRRQQINDG